MAVIAVAISWRTVAAAAGVWTAPGSSVHAQSFAELSRTMKNGAGKWAKLVREIEAQGR